MSYILDALRKADAERERGHIPGIHAQPSFGGPAPNRAPPSVSPLTWLAAGGAGMLAVGAAAWFAFGSVRPAAEVPSPAPIATGPTPSMVSPAAPAPAATASAPPPGTAPANAPVARAASPAVTAPVPPTEAARTRAQPAPAARTPKPALAAASTPAPTGAAASAVSGPDTRSATGGSGGAGVTTAAGQKVYPIAELPDDIRRQLPALSVGGSMFSPKPADRILIINGQVLHEGERIAPDLLLVQIRVKAAVLEFKGYRYVVAF